MTIELRLPVLWGYMDALGHVNNTIYFRFFESARVEYMAQMGLFATQAGDHEVVPILARWRSPPASAWSFASPSSSTPR